MSLVPLRCNYVWSRDGHYTDCDDEQLLEIFAYKTFEFTVSEKEKLVSSITVNTSMQSDK